MSALRVLVVDDDEPIRSVLCRMFTHLGSQAQCVARGLPAVAAVEQSEGIDLAIIDCNLPDVAGLIVARAIRSACPSARVVLSTGTPHADRQDEFEVLAKPFGLFEIAALVDAVRQSSNQVVPVGGRLYGLR